ncbi:MAG: SPASM domain-containing protein [Elusimicrobiota bacterium]|nr:SPASM domain-containing protein [Elusimicrobiota bacterium]
MFYMVSILANGNAHCCGCTYPMPIIGNCFETPLKDLWNKAEHLRLMKAHCSDMRESIPECARCFSVYQHNLSEDNIDEYMEEILKRL